MKIPKEKYFRQEYFGILRGAQEMLRKRYTVGSFQHAQLSWLAGPEQEIPRDFQESTVGPGVARSETMEVAA